MAGETFYTYLHGPRTFWGNSGSNIRINNNFGFPCTPPMMLGCGCGCGSNNIWSTMMILNSMMAQTLPYWNFSKSEGAGDSSATGSTTPLDKLTTARQTLDQIGFTQAAGYSLYLDESGNIIYRYSKDGKECSATSMADLTAKITAGTSEGRGGSDVSIVADDSTISVDDDSSVNSTDETDETDSVADASDSGNVANSGRTTRKYKRGKPGVGFEWTTFNKLTNNNLKAKIQDKNCKTVVDLMKTLMPYYFEGKSDAQIKGSTYYKLLMAANPGAIDDNGKIVNKAKLDIIVKKTAGTTVNSRNKAHKISTKNGYSLERTDNGSYVYQHNGKKVTAEEFAKACPQTFINEHNKRWTPETIKAALKAFDSIKCPKYNNSGKGYLNWVTTSFLNDKKFRIIVGYKGNGMFNNYQYTMTYTGTNGILGKDISDIYEEVTQGYNRIGD